MHSVNKADPKYPYISGGKINLAEAAKYSELQIAATSCVDPQTGYNLVKAHGTV